MSTKRVKVARCPECQKIIMACVLPDGDTDTATLKDFADCVRKGFEIAYIDDPSEVGAKWGECVHRFPELAQSELFAK